MEAILLGIYSFFVWLIFIKLKWLPWNIATQVIVVIIPIVGLAALILLLNIFAPSSSDVRVYKYTVPIVSQVRGRVIEVPVEEGNRLVKKGDVLFRIDPTPYQLEVNTLEAQLVGMQGSQRELQEQAKGAAGQDRGVAEPRARGRRAARPDAQARRSSTASWSKTGAGSRSTWSAPRPTRSSSRASSTPRATPRRRRAPACGADPAEARRHGEGRVLAGGAGARAARERAMAARADHHALALRLLRRQPAAAPRRLRRRPAAQPGDDAGRGRAARWSRSTTRTSCTRWSPATRSSSR